MKPYYQDEHVTLYHGDCLEIEAWRTADVLVTDPPYGIGWSKGAATERHGTSKGIRNDKDTVHRDEVVSLMADKPKVIFGSPLIPPPAGTRQALVYQKPSDAGFFGSIAGFRRDWEMIYLCGTWPKASPSNSSVLKTAVRSVNNITARRYPKDTGAGHPHAKPLDVMEMLIRGCPVGVIADPFAGAGATLVAARSLGRHVIGVELEERYCEIAAQRLSVHTLDIELT